jgi:hypothetical protein
MPITKNHRQVSADNFLGESDSTPPPGVAEPAMHLTGGTWTHLRGSAQREGRVRGFLSRAEGQRRGRLRSLAP